MTRLLLIALDAGCGYCGATAGAHCRAKKSGKRSTYMHEARIAPIREAYALGYDDRAGDDKGRR
jgi:hypothetical protein